MCSRCGPQYRLTNRADFRVSLRCARLRETVWAMPINWSDGKFAENGARALAEHLLDIAKASLSSDVLTDEDRAELERHRKKLENSFREMLKVIDDLEKTKPSAAFHGRICLLDIMDSAFIIGARGIVTDSHKNFLVRKPASDGGKKGGATHKTRAEAWHVEARDHLPDVEKNNPGLSPRKLAPFVISLCCTKIGVEAMTKFIRKEREARPCGRI
jgi:hypothetical protein